MQKSLLNIFHYADIQLELRVSGEGSQRHFEFQNVLNQLEKTIEDEKPDIVVIAGDIYQYADTNGEEQEMFSLHLHQILPHTSRIIIIPGNHDIKQKNNAIVKDGEKTSIGDSIKSIVTSIKSDKISYYNHTGIYKDSVFDLSWAVWSQITKHSSIEPKPAYSPWSENDVPKGAFIELFHDPIRNAKNFSGEPDKTFEKYGISLADFKANLIIAGDIHNPDIIYFDKNKVFTYSSSLVMRNFGEGDYFSNEVKRISGNAKHGYNKILFDPETNTATSVEFVKIQNPIERYTFNLSKDFDYTESSIKTLTLGINMKIVKPMIRIIASGNLSKYVESAQLFDDIFKSKFPNVELSLECTSDIILEQDVNTDELQDLESALDRNKIIDLSKAYINKLVDSTSTIDKDDKEEAKKYIIELFVDEFNKQTFDQTLNLIALKSFKVDNFMNFDSAEIEFTNNNITRITGTNGIGKTKIWSFLAWLFTDSISSNLNSKEKTYNYSLYFNDSSEKDEVIGSGMFHVNGELHQLTKTMTRTWKKNKKDIKQQDWYKNLTSAPSVELSLSISKSTGLVELQNDEVVEYLKNLVGTFKDFEKFTFIDGIKLRELINHDNTYVIQEVLDAMGLTIIDNLLASYSQIKDEKLDNLKKPEYNAKEYQVLIDFENEIIKSQSEKLEETKTKNDESKSEIERKTEQVKILESTKHQVKNEEALELETITLSDEINDCKKIIDNLNFELTESIGHIDLDYNSMIEEKQLEIDKYSKFINDKKTQIQENQIQIQNIKLEHHKLLAEENKKWQEKSSEAITKISEISNKLNILENAKTKVLQTFIDEVAEINSKSLTLYLDEFGILNDLSNQAKTIENELKVLDTSIAYEETSLAKSEETLEKLESNEGKCLTCDNKLIGENLKAYERSVDDQKHQNLKLANKITDLKIKKKALVDDESEIADKITKQKVITNKAKVTLDETTELLSKCKNDKTLVKNDYLDITTFINESTKYDDAISTLNLNKSVLENETSREKLQLHLVEFTKTDTTYLALATDSSNLSTLIDVIESEKLVYENKLTVSQNEKVDLHTLRSEQLERQENRQKIKDKILLQESQIRNNNARIDKIEKTELPLAKINAELQHQIDKVNDEIYMIRDMMETSQLTYQTLLFGIQQSKDKIDTYETGISDYRKYRIADSSLKLYKKLLSKDGLPQHIFSAIVPIINKILNDGLTTVDFRLIFHPESLDLIFIDTARNASRPIQFISGMQETIVGLAITSLLITLNQSTKYNFMFIDEISGKVTDGSQLTYASKNYKEILTAFIHELSKTTNLFIIDPVLQYKNERVLEVQPTENGSTIIELTYATK